MIGLVGRFKFIRHKDGKVLEETGWSRNLVLDNGLKSVGSQSIARYCRVGTGSSEPRVDQMELDHQVASTASFPENIRYPDTGVNVQEAYFWSRYTFRFATGIAAGALTEVGVGWGNEGQTLFNRALIRDARGNRVTVTVLDDETLDVVVEIRMYVDTAPQMGSVNAVLRKPEGNVEETFQIKVIPLLQPINQQIVLHPLALSSNNYPQGYFTELVSTTARPTGQLDSFKNSTWLPKTDKNERTFEIYWGINEGNGRPLKSVVIPTQIGTFQAELTPGFPKSIQYVLRLGFTISWTRYEGDL